MNYTLTGNSPILGAGVDNDVFPGSGRYQGFLPASGAVLSVVSTDIQDVGSEVDNGAVGSGTDKMIICHGKDFTLTVSPGDIFLNDTQGLYGFVVAVEPEILRFDKMYGELPNYNYRNKIDDVFRVGNSTGNGASVVKLSRLLDESYEPMVDAFVILNGTTPVSTSVSTYIRNSKAEVLQSSVSSANTGVLSCVHGAYQMWSIAVERASTDICCDTVPVGFWLELNDLQALMTRASGAVGSCTMVFESKRYGGPFVTDIYAVISSDKEYYSGKETIYLAPKSDFRWRVLDTSSASTSVRAEVFGSYRKDR